MCKYRSIDSIYTDFKKYNRKKINRFFYSSCQSSQRVMTTDSDSIQNKISWEEEKNKKERKPSSILELMSMFET